MDCRAAELWKHAASIAAKWDRLGRDSKAKVQSELLDLLGLGNPDVTNIEETRPTLEDFEHALNSTMLNRLESSNEEHIAQAIDILDITASIVVEIFKRPARPGALQNETDSCKLWWIMLFSVAEYTAKLLPTSLFGRLVSDLEVSLPTLRSSYLQLALQRLVEFDTKQQMQANLAEDKRIDDRKKTIALLGISPNGQLYLPLTSLLKQLGSRLCSSLHADLRARIVLLLERLLAMDHKAIANNQKLKTQEFIQSDDLDKTPKEGMSSTLSTEVSKLQNGDASTKEAGESGAHEGQGLGNDPAVNFDFYASFWALQEHLLHPERALERESWAGFRGTLSKVLGLFKKYPVQERPLQPWSPPEPAPLRHAPRVGALVVQLEDPGFRQQFLTQVLLAFHTLEQDSGGRHRGDVGGIIGRQPDPVRADFAELKKLCQEALAHTRPGFEPLLAHALEREAHWVTWKTNGCREFERESLEMLNAKIGPADTLHENEGGMRTAKPQLPAFVNTILKALKDPQWQLPVEKYATEEEEMKSMRTCSTLKMCDAYLDRLIEEDKPEAEVEEEYKAKGNKVLMWQCRRLFCQHYMRVYARKDIVNKTEFMDIVNLVKFPAPPNGQTSTQLDEVVRQDSSNIAQDGASPPEGPDDGAAVVGSPVEPASVTTASGNDGGSSASVPATVKGGQPKSDVAATPAAGAGTTSSSKEDAKLAQSSPESSPAAGATAAADSVSSAQNVAQETNVPKADASSAKRSASEAGIDAQQVQQKKVKQ
eukprot:TRINITY_DN55504_c0_g1_i1.p1 TRINITY_DN55504_c0_g1~~TRINITY_DN55504_c0_g1_i1.p1  ORF type:complete len:766 (+),score=132.07 TRINITY_DN55504_c0_g1_i1:55-2352(+)